MAEVPEEILSGGTKEMNWYCYYCQAKFTDIEQNRSQQDDEVCPYCKGDFLIDLEDAREEDKEEELLQLPSTPIQRS